MSRSQVDRPLGKSIRRMLFGASRSRASTPRRRRAAPVAAQIEILEDRVLLSAVLGTADSFAVLAGSTVTNTGPSVISGDVGVSPGSAITGFPPGIVINGTIHATDAVAAQAQSDVTIAYDDLASRAPDADLTGQDLGGMTLTAGVYFFSSSAQLTGTLTLDAQGDPDAEFIFQIGSTLTTASNSSVVILNGGSPCDVFWQVGSSATVGTTTVFVGNILALTSITLDNGASVEGSVLARNGAVTLDNNVITDVDCTEGTSSISGVKYNDLNGDGIRQAGEDGLPGLTVFLDTNGNGSLDSGEKRTTTEADGSYSFTGLDAGTYLVRQSNLADSGLVQTSPNPDEITLGDDEDVTGVDFGDFFVVSISGTKFEDVNGDGVRNDGEGGLPGVTVFLDANNNGTLDMGETSTTTDANGEYTFTNLGPGTYLVRQSLPPGLIQTTDNPDAIVPTSGENVTGVDFGDIPVANLFPISKLLLTGRNLTNFLDGTFALQATFVANLFQDSLGRAPTLAELTGYLRLLMAGFTEAQITTMFNQAYIELDSGLLITGGDSSEGLYQVTAGTADPLALRAFELDQSLGLRYTGNYSTNWGGAGEEWLQSASGVWHFITPDGTLYRWSGTRAGATFLSGSTVVATLSPAYHQAPSLLHDARLPAASVLPAEPSLTLSHNAGPLAIDLPETDADGDRLSYQVELLTADPLMLLAYQLDQQLSLRFTGNYSQNWGGANEKWLQTASGTWHFITPDGTLYRWSGSRPGSGFLAGSTVVGRLDGSYHADPARLHNAQPVAGGDPGGSTVRVENGNQLVVTPGAGYVGDLRIRLTTSDGVAETAQIFTIEVTNTPPTLSLADQVIGAGEDPLTLTLPAIDADGDPLTYQAELVGDPLLELAYELDQQLGLRFTGNFSQNWGGANEKWLQSASGVWHFITPEGTLYRWNGTPRGSGFLSGSTVVATLDSSFWAEPDRLYNAAPPGASTGSSVSVDGNQIVVTPHAGFTGVLRLRISVSDGLTSVSRTILVNVLDRVAVDGGFASWDGLD